jgi:hypothetical protein
MVLMGDGYQTTIDFSAFAEGSSDASLLLLMEEKEITPPGISGGGANDASTMRNSTWRTMSPKSLRTLTPATFTVAWDPAIYDEMVAMINQNQLIKITFPDGSTLQFWGWLDEFTPGPNTEGSQPTATMTIQPSNQDGDNNDAEYSPVYTAA